MIINELFELVKMMEKEKDSSYPFMVTVESKGFDGNKFFWIREAKFDNKDYTKETDALFSGLVLFNCPKKLSLDFYGFRNLLGRGLGFQLTYRQTGIKEVIPLLNTNEIKTADDLEDLIKDKIPAYEDYWLEKTFKSNQLISLKNDYKDSFEAYNCSKSWKINEEKPTISKQDWIDQGYPCAYRYGFGFRGAKANRISRREAQKKINDVFESNFEQQNGEYVLVLQDYGANDFY